MKRIKMGGLNVLLLFAHNAPSEQHTPTRGVIWYVQSYLVLHLHAKKRLATNKQKTRTQRRSSRHGNNHCPDLLKIKIIKFCGKIRKTPNSLIKCALCVRPIESMTSIKSTPYSFRRFLASVALFIQNTHFPFVLSV